MCFAPCVLRLAKPARSRSSWGCAAGAPSSRDSSSGRFCAFSGSAAAGVLLPLCRERGADARAAAAGLGLAVRVEVLLGSLSQRRPLTTAAFRRVVCRGSYELSELARCVGRDLWAARQQFITGALHAAFWEPMHSREDASDACPKHSRRVRGGLGPGPKTETYSKPPYRARRSQTRGDQNHKKSPETRHRHQ